MKVCTSKYTCNLVYTSHVDRRVFFSLIFSLPWLAGWLALLPLPPQMNNATLHTLVLAVKAHQRKERRQALASGVELPDGLFAFTPKTKKEMSRLIRSIQGNYHVTWWADSPPCFALFCQGRKRLGPHAFDGQARRRPWSGPACAKHGAPLWLVPMPNALSNIGVQ